MKSDQVEPGLNGIFLRLIATSRRLLRQQRNAPTVELDSLSNIIEKEIIPRLQMSFTGTHESPEVSTPAKVRPEYDVERFVDALLSQRADDAQRFISDLRDTEHSLVQIYQHLLAPAAARLGEMWEDDLCSFAEVTIAITKIRHIFIATAPLFPVAFNEDTGDAPAILLTTVPGEQHTFGLYLAVEMFRAANWSVWSGTPRSMTELVGLVERERYDVVGLSVSASRNAGAISTAIAEIRKHSANPQIQVIIGGNIVTKRPELLEDLNIDLIATDIDTITAQAAALLQWQQPAPL
ncbi:MAG: cobalamin B12-binding domain-containing protein [Pseudomonadota bacterium]